MSGIDPYASAVSDVYQDLFGEGSYAGKGIYDVDAFEAALAGRVPDSTLLSHDLFEGVFARAGLASDVEVVEEFPARYDVAALRHHRWARGDWQLLPWILGRGPRRRARIGSAAPFRRSAAGRCSTICGGRCRRRRPSSPCWPDGPCRFDAALVWTVFVLATIVLPTLIPVVAAIVPAPDRDHGAQPPAARSAAISASRSTLSALMIIFLAHQAWLMGDAIARTSDPAVRHPPASARMGSGGAGDDRSAARPSRLLSPDGRRGRHRRCGGDRRLAWGHGTWPLALPFAALWLASPAIARWASLSPLVAGRLSMSDGDARALRLIARRTWRFFETFVTPADQHAAAGQFPGRSGAGRSRIGPRRPISASISCRS